MSPDLNGDMMNGVDIQNVIMAQVIIEMLREDLIIMSDVKIMVDEPAAPMLAEQVQVLFEVVVPILSLNILPVFIEMVLLLTLPEAFDGHLVLLPEGRHLDGPQGGHLVDSLLHDHLVDHHEDHHEGLLLVFLQDVLPLEDHLVLDHPHHMDILQTDLHLSDLTQDILLTHLSVVHHLVLDQIILLEDLEIRFLLAMITIPDHHPKE